MKKLILFTLFIVANLCISEVYAQQQGIWGEENERSITPDRPIGSVANNMLTIDFTSFIIDLTVQITDNKTGAVVYQEVLMIPQPSQYVIDINFLPAGEYTYHFIHRCGHLWAGFIIE